MSKRVILTDDPKKNYELLIKECDRMDKGLSVSDYYESIDINKVEEECIEQLVKEGRISR